MALSGVMEVDVVEAGATGTGGFVFCRQTEALASGAEEFIAPAAQVP